MSGLDSRLPYLSIAEIAAELKRRRSVGRRTVRFLMDDPRIGVRALGERYRAQLLTRERERARLRRLLAAEREFREDGIQVIAGVDEVGVAPIAGPVVAAAVVLPDGWVVEGLDDSKRLDPSTRIRLDREIRDAARAVGIAVVSERMIDRVNVYQASLMAMRLALQRLTRPFDLALLDGRPPRTFAFPHRAVIGGDRRIRSIAAASIVAKVARDRLMMEADRRWPGYGFSNHKGYPTRRHLQALRARGLCPLHRLSVARVWQEADAMGPVYRDLSDRLVAADSTASLEAAEFAFDAALASLHASEEKLLRELLEERRKVVAMGGDPS